MTPIYRSDIIEVLSFLKRLFADGGPLFLRDFLIRLAGGDGQALLPKLAGTRYKPPRRIRSLMRCCVRCSAGNPA